jgi:hypothetical protein
MILTTGIAGTGYRDSGCVLQCNYRDSGYVSFPRNFVFQEKGYNAL